LRVTDESVYRVRMFKERGYERRKCPKCGAYFWSLKERDDCGDAPCADYEFLINPSKYRSTPLTVAESQDKFLNFFRRLGHEVIKPYPVVARWRDDLYLTIASIVVFQPHVTSGIVPPPANPLVIAQPCIRLEDLDSVGYTFGRHLTSFIMGGHHAFNYPNKKVYFTDETVEYARDFFVKELGIPEDELVFKESWWEGGGNAGPCFEVAVGGLELATLVFMMYRSVDGEYEEMPLKVVDTGYGIERIAWFTQKTPTAFHAIYGDLVKSFHKVLSLGEAPDELLRTAVKYVGRLNPRDPEKYVLLKERVASELGLDVREVDELLDREVKVLALLDLTRTAALMLADGVVPSNTGEGYLARLVLRRLFRLMALLGGLDYGKVAKLFELEAGYWRGLFPQIRGHMGYILDVVDVELSRFKEILRKAPAVIRRFAKKAGRIGVDELITLYDSHGIPPDVVAEEAERLLGLRINIPPNFYELVASKHSRAPIKGRKGKAKLPDEVIRAVKLSNIPETEAIFHKDPYAREFDATVKLAVGRYVVLDRTCFYPEGGGQACDTGVLVFEDGVERRVVNVQKVGKVVVHELDSEVPGDVVGERVHGRIDWLRRYSLMRHHTATHIILGSARRVLGDHVWQAGAEKRVEGARLDITHYKPLTLEEIRRIEDTANRVVDEGIEVKARYMGKYEAEGRYGFRLYEGGVILEPVIRVVSIDEFDAEACFGTHVLNTREVGAVKIVRAERIADGVVRLEFVAGSRVSDYARRLEERLNEVSKILGGEALQRARALTEELKKVRDRLKLFKQAYREAVLSELKRSERRVNGVRVFTHVMRIPDTEVARWVLQKLSSENPDAVALIVIPGSKRLTVEISAGSKVAEVVPANELARRAAKALGGKGGGKATHATLVTDPSVGSDALVNFILNEVRKVLGKSC